MTRVIEAIWDGEALRPTEPLHLEPNSRYRVILEENGHASSKTPRTGVFDDLLDLATDLGPPDLAEQFDHYLYGTPKR